MKFNGFEVGKLYIVCPAPEKLYNLSDKWSNEIQYDNIKKENIEVLSYYSEFVNLGQVTLSPYISKNKEDDLNWYGSLFVYKEPFVILEKYKNYDGINDKLLILQTFNENSILGYIDVKENILDNLTKYIVYGKIISDGVS